MITFEIHNIDDGDIGRYRCMASNKFGSDNSIGQLNYESKANLSNNNGRRCSQNSSDHRIDHRTLTCNTNRLMLTRNQRLLRQSIRLIGKIFLNSPPIVQVIIYAIIVYFVSIILSHYLFPIDTMMINDSAILNQVSTTDDCSGSISTSGNPDVDSILKNLQEYIFRCSNNK